MFRFLKRLSWWIGNIPARREVRRRLKEADVILSRTEDLIVEARANTKFKTGKERSRLVKQLRDLRDIKRHWKGIKSDFQDILKYLSW